MQLHAPISCQEEYHQEFLNGEWQEGQWYEKVMTIGIRKTDLNIQVIYVSNVKEIPDLMIEGEVFDLKLTNENIWYHGTAAMSLASIIKDGIDLRRGSPNLDFSSGDGFYMFQSLEFAKKWAIGRDNKVWQPQKTRRSNEASGNYDVVFIFQFDRSKYSGIDLSSNTKKMGGNS